MMTMEPLFMTSHKGLQVQGTFFGHHCFEAL